MVPTSRPIREGLIVGVIGYASVAVFYSAFDLLAARGSLHTVNMLGKCVFRGLRNPAVLGLPMQVDLTATALYNGFHLLMSLVIGLIVTGLVKYSNRGPSQARMALFTIVAGFVVTIITVGQLTNSIRPLLPWWSIVVANVFAVLLPSVYLLRKHPALWGKLNPFAS